MTRRRAIADPMPVYVDRAANRFGRMVMCHMIADTRAELFSMAERLALKPEWYQVASFPHFDLSKTKRAKAIALGAVELNRRQFGDRMKTIRAAPSWPREWLG